MEDRLPGRRGRGEGKKCTKMHISLPCQLKYKMCIGKSQSALAHSGELKVGLLPVFMVVFLFKTGQPFVRFVNCHG